MPPKDSGGKKGGGPKALEALAGLNAFVSTYKAASRRYGVAPLKPILLMLEESIADGGTAINKVGSMGALHVQPMWMRRALRRGEPLSRRAEVGCGCGCNISSGENVDTVGACINACMGKARMAARQTHT